MELLSWSININLSELLVLLLRGLLSEHFFMLHKLLK
jgi:hypothetical protein